MLLTSLSIKFREDPVLCVEFLISSTPLGVSSSTPNFLKSSACPEYTMVCKFYLLFYLWENEITEKKLKFAHYDKPWSVERKLLVL